MPVKKQRKNICFLFLNWVFTVGCSSSRTRETFPNPNSIEMRYGLVNWDFLRKFQLQNAHLGLLFSSLLKMYMVGQD